MAEIVKCLLSAHSLCVYLLPNKMLPVFSSHMGNLSYLVLAACILSREKL